MKKFVLWILVVCMLFTMSMVNITTAVADGANLVGTDTYSLNPEGYPSKHWCLMTEDEIALYEELGWERVTGVLWYDDERYVIDFTEINTADIQNMYNAGYTCHVLYTWVCPARKLNKYQEQSVSVGSWILSPEQAEEYQTTVVVPWIDVMGLNENPEVSFMSQWYYENMASSMPDINLTEGKEKYLYVRYVFDTYEYGKGSVLYLRNGDQLEYTFDEVLEVVETSGGFENELPVWYGARHNN